MDWLTPLFIVLICLAPTIGLFFTGEKEYVFHRNIFKARQLQTEMLAAVAIVSMGFVFVEYKYYLKDMVTFGVLFLSMGILSVVNFAVKGEGAYNKGMLIKGAFMPWHMIGGYQFEKSKKTGDYILYLHMQNKKATRTRKYKIEETYKYTLEKSLKKHIR